MSMVKPSVAKAVATALALSAAGAASAAINDSPSDLFIAVWNPTTSESFVQDLGTGFSNANLNGSFNTAGFTASTTVDGSIANLQSAIGSGTYTFVLFAGDETQHTKHTTTGGLTANYLGDSMFFSQTAGNKLSTYQNGQVIDGGSAALVVTYVNQFSVGTAGFAATDDHSAGSKYWASTTNVNSPGANFNLATPGSATGSGAVNLIKFLATATTDQPTDNATSAFVGASGSPGVFTLNDSTGLLSYSVAGAGGQVPLPAAGWLLVSGLLGLGAVGRRKAAAAS